MTTEVEDLPADRIVFSARHRVYASTDINGRSFPILFMEEMMNRTRSLVKITMLGASVSLAALTMLPASTLVARESAGGIGKGKELAFSRKDGNCLACHLMEGAVSPGTIAPPLIAMKSRFPEKAALRAQIWDSTARNPETSMPPFGKYGILSEQEIDDIVEFIWTL